MNKTLYFADENEDRYFFLIPDNIDLMPGDFEISTIIGHRQQVNPDALRPFIIPREEAEKHLSQQMKAGIQKAADGAKSFFKSLNKRGHPDSTKDTRPKITLELLSDLMGVSLEDLQSNPEARQTGWKNLLEYVMNAITYSMSDDPEANEAAYREMQAADKLFTSYGIATHGFFSQTPEHIKNLYEAAKEKQQAIEANENDTDPS